MPSALSTFAPPSPLAGRLSVQSVPHAVGDGTFMTAGAVFFTRVVSLFADQLDPSR